VSVTSVVVALVPVVVFLVVLFFMDRFKLVRPDAALTAIAWGAVAAGVSLWINGVLLDVLKIPPGLLSRYLAPPIEEAAKALPLIIWLKRGRIGFLVDAAIVGFAVGTGFALVENVHYLSEMPGSLALWAVRGFGTAMLHGGTSAIFAMLANAAADRQTSRAGVAFANGWLAAVIIHAAFNYQVLPAVAQMLLILIALPMLMLWVFSRSERAMAEWIGAGLDLDVDLLQLITSDVFEETRMGQYLRELRKRLPGTVVADMYCLLRLELELAVQAKAMLMAREAGVDVKADADFDALLTEHDSLQRSMGRTGLLALKPLQVSSRRDRWHRHVLQTRRAIER
jgi:RsiW-degrading membrane proteinase PrsW (M82 family)